MVESIVLGIIQGVTEWLPVSSEGVLILVQTFLFEEKASVQDMVGLAVFLHLGTAVAATIYFAKDIRQLFISLLHWREAVQEDKQVISFLVIATIISGVIGYLLFSFLGYIEERMAITGQMVLGVIGALLIVTAVMQLARGHGGRKRAEELTTADAILLGIVQGFAVLPGVSRSGATIGALLLRKYENDSKRQ